MNSLIILVGLPGSGKSTWTQNFLKKNDDYVVISSDNIIERKGAAEGLNYSQAFEKYVGAATTLMMIEAKQAFKEKKNIIWDQTNMSIKSRKKKVEMGKLHGYEISAVVFSIPDTELYSRLKNREQETGKHIPEFVIKNMANSYQPPAKGEGFSSVRFVKQ